MPVISTRRPGKDPSLLRLLAARPAAAGVAGPLRGGPPLRQSFLDRVEPPPDRAQLRAQLTEIIRRRGPALVDHVLDALAHGAGAGLRAADELVDGLLGAGPRRLRRLLRAATCRLCRLARRVEGAFDG